MSPTRRLISSGDRPVDGRPPRLPGPAPPASRGDDDATLLAALRDDCTVAAALEAVYRDHVPAVRARLRRGGLDADLAEDAVQEAVIQLWAGRSALPEHLSIRAWLTVIAGRRAVDAVRRHRWPQHCPDEPAWPTARGDDPAELVLRRERQRQIWRLLDLLDPDERGLIALLYWEGMDQARVAARLHRSLAALTSWVHRVRLYLATAWLALEAGRRPPPRRRLPRRDDH